MSTSTHNTAVRTSMLCDSGQRKINYLRTLPLIFWSHRQKETGSITRCHEQSHAARLGTQLRNQENRDVMNKKFNKYPPNAVNPSRTRPSLFKTVDPQVWTHLR
jgi:hypothetical protein